MASDDLEARRAMITHEAVIDTGRYLKALRHEAGLTQKELSERAGMTQARISIIEN
jgi:predicted transcriptional regulator